MQVKVSGRHTTVSENLRQQATEKIGKLDRYLGMERADVHFWVEKNARSADREFCEVTIEGHGHHVRTRVHAPDGFTAVDLAVDKLERQLRKLKTKVANKKRGRERVEIPPGLVPDTLIPAGSEAPEPVYKIVKTKNFTLPTIDPEEAALQMDLVDHGFFLFINSQTGASAVVYRRDDGDVGLIDTSAAPD